MISILILTLNEEENLPGCFDSIQWCDDVVILDSFSSDNTKALAESFGARIVERKFDNYASQRNFGLKSIDYKHKWVLMLDADERVSDELYKEMKTIRDINFDNPDISMCLMRRKDYFFGKWIKRSSGYPTWFGRLVRPDQVEVKREINEEYHTLGKIIRLNGHLLHYPFNKGISHWIQRHNRYSTMEAVNYLEKDKESIAWKNLLSRDPLERRKQLKKVIYSLPCRPFIVFTGLYILRGGFLEGKAGFRFASLKFIYECMTQLKISEIKRRQSGKPL